MQCLLVKNLNSAFPRKCSVLFRRKVLYQYKASGQPLGVPLLEMWVSIHCSLSPVSSHIKHSGISHPCRVLLTLTPEGDANREINKLLEVTLHVGNISSCLIPPPLLREHCPVLNFDMLHLLSYHKDKHTVLKNNGK